MEKIEKVIKILEAFNNGEIIEFFHPYTNTWMTVSGTNDLLERLKDVDCGDSGKIRIRKEPKYRPYKNKEEFLKDCIKHRGILTCSNRNDYFSVINFGDDGVSYNWGHDHQFRKPYNVIFEWFLWADDNSPCGVLIKE